MSRVMTLDGEQVHFILNSVGDINTETEGLNDIIYSDGTRAILVNDTGQILQSDAQAVVLQDNDFNQYYINDESGDILVTDDQDIAVTGSFGDGEVVQFVEEDDNVTAEPQIIYVNEEGYAINDADLSQYQIAEGSQIETIFPSKSIKLEAQVVDLEELMREHGENEMSIIDASSATNEYQYAILKDGKLHLQPYDGDVLSLTSPQIPEEQTVNPDIMIDKRNVDLSRITGKNLLTGQKISLHGYMNKLSKKRDEVKERVVKTDRKRNAVDATGLKKLLNKKLTLGRTSNGKKLVGKVIHVAKKMKSDEGDVTGNVEEVEEGNESETEMGSNREEEEVLETVEETADDLALDSNEPILPDQTTEKPPENPPPSDIDERKVLVKEKLVSKEGFDHIHRALSGLMTMESVRKKLQHKNIIVKVVERRYDEETTGYVKKVSYSGGHMLEELLLNEEGQMSESWSFVSDDNVVASILGLGRGEEGDRQSESRYSETTNITLVVTYEKNGHRAIRVVLNPSNTVKCPSCPKEFPTPLLFRAHLVNDHCRGRRSRGKTCEVCCLHFEDPKELERHRDKHRAEGKLFRCPVEGCGKLFLTVRKLRRHRGTHSAEQRAVKCSVCRVTCTSQWTLKKHMSMHVDVNTFTCETCGKHFANHGDLNFHKRVHDPYKCYACKVCKRTFSRHSNLQRHIEIHKGTGELYQCTICGCSYHYMSSLTRHVVQNHVKRQEVDGIPTLLEEVTEGA